jgi:hypothetical protein
LQEKGIRADIARKVNWLEKRLDRQKLVARPGQKVVETPNGTTLETGLKGGGTFVQDWFY